MLALPYSKYLWIPFTHFLLKTTVGYNCTYHHSKVILCCWKITCSFVCPLHIMQQRKVKPSTAERLIIEFSNTSDRLTVPINAIDNSSASLGLHECHICNIQNRMVGHQWQAKRSQGSNISLDDEKPTSGHTFCTLEPVKRRHTCGMPLVSLPIHLFKQANNRSLQRFPRLHFKHQRCCPST